MEKLLNIKEVANVLGLATPTVIEIVRDGGLPASRIRGGKVRAHEVRYDTYGLRFHPDDVRDFIRSTAVH